MKPTSKEGHEFIKPHKPNHSAKIKEGLTRLRIGGTHEEIATVSGMKECQVWKRLSEMERNEIIFDTGIKRKLKSGVHGIVWQLVGMKPVDTTSIKTQAQQNAANILKQLNLYAGN